MFTLDYKVVLAKKGDFLYCRQKRADEVVVTNVMLNAGPRKFVPRFAEIWRFMSPETNIHDQHISFT